MKNMLVALLLLGTALISPCDAQELAGKFSPPSGKVLVFTGQDNASVGGTAEYQNGYVDNIGVPAGITHYVYFSEGWTNAFGRTFAPGQVAGLNSETEWASGPMHQKAYLDSSILDPCVMHVSIAMEGNCEDKVADGSFDHLINEFVQFVKDHPDHPFLIRIGYEFDGSWNKYDPENFKKAFRRIVDSLRAAQLTNYATVFASSSSVKPGQFEEYDPGADYYDWIGYSWWGGEKDGSPALEFARKVGKPVFIAEATPRGHFFNLENPQEVWNEWFVKFFDHIEENRDVIRAISYINADWDAQDMWDGWGQTRIETVPLLKQRWLEKMADPMFVNAEDQPFQLIGFPTSPSVAGQNITPYKNSSLPIDTRLNDLLSRMTLEEKVAQITGWWDPSEEKLREQGRIFTPEFYAEKCPHSIGELGPLHNLTIDEDALQYAAIQDYFRNQTRLGIPAMLHDEAAHGFMRFEANSFPTPIGISCSWNPELIAKLYSQAGREARSRGIAHVLSPIVDVARDLRWGRVDETLGEDPFLVSRLGAAMVRGLQGSNDGTVAPDHVAATLKHFAGYANTSGGRNRAPYTHGPRHLLDTEVEPFRYVIKNAKPNSVMVAFNEVDGLPCHVNPWILQDILRDSLGFEGLIVGDYQGIDLVRKYQKIGTSDADAGRMALQAGLQLELPNNFGFKHLPKLVQEGKVNIDEVDAAARAVLELKLRLGLFEAPEKLDLQKAKSLASSPQATELAREAARQSIVLLKNENNLLPLTVGEHETIAVIGPNANVCRLGNYSGRPLKTVSLLEGIRNFVGDNVNVTHAEGCRIANNDTGDSYANWRYVNDIEFTSLEENQPLIEQAVGVANEADVVILALGENVLLAREAWGGNHVGDRTTLDLTESQKVLADAVLATGKPVVLFLNNSKPVTLHALGDQIPAIMTAHYAGQETGTAAAEIIFGETNPTGKLTLSWPRSVGHLPVHYSQNGSAQVFDYVDSPRSVVYPFGHGLSYTTFAYGDARVSGNQIRAGETVNVDFEITNTGQRQGTEIAQLYVSGESFSLARPQLELKGFARIALQPGETQSVSIPLHADDLHFHDTSLQRVLPDGKYVVRVGTSSAELGEPVNLITKAVTLPLDAQSKKKLAHSGVPHSGVPVASRAHSGVPTANLPHSGVPTSPPAHSGVPAASLPHSGVPNPTTIAPTKALKPSLAPGKRPNVLFIAIDDLRPELGTYGTKTITPNIDKLARSGTRFDRAYCQQAVCGASRLSLMCGLYPTMTQEQTFHVSGWRDRHPDLLTMNQHFGQQGYNTIGLGKIYHGHSGAGVDRQNWNRWLNVSAPHYASPENIEILREALEKGDVGNSKDPAKGPLTESADVHDDTYVDGKRASKTVEILQSLGQQNDKPFFLAVGLAKPHLPFVAPQKYWDLYDRNDFSMPANASIPPGYPRHAANLMAHEMHKYSDFEGSSPRDFSDDLNRRLLHGYAAATSYADACVGRIMAGLEQAGLADDTIVVLWGDHGWKLGDHSSWVKHTNFECDTRTPLIIHDPRLVMGQSTSRLVELIDLYPTLCELTGIPTPAHCQGKSFHSILTDPQAGHRMDAYSSYPAGKLLGHSLRLGDFRYTEWRNQDGATTARVLTDLKADPGEETNVLDDPAYREIATRAAERLEIRIRDAQSNKPLVTQTAPVKETVSPATNKTNLAINTRAGNLRQTIEGFGGSIAFWGTQADDEALQAAVQGLDVAIIRAQGEVSKNGRTDYNRDILQRAMKLNPDLQVLLTFWQPRSSEHPETEYWLDVKKINGSEQFALKPYRQDEWADEMVRRIQQYREWGINVPVIGVQNESNWSHPGTQTCRWDPQELRTFIEQKLKPRLKQAGLGQIEIAAPDLAFIGPGASEIQNFMATLQSPAVDIAAYHMYDSYPDGQPGTLQTLIDSTTQLGMMREQFIPNKRLWMTETTGAQWNGAEWHTYGWTPDLTEHDKAIKVARYIHMTLVNANANAFLWWGLVYSLAPENVTDPNTRQKHRDEGLVLVQEKDSSGYQTMLEKTKKYHVFRQYSGFIRPGFQRIEMPVAKDLQVSAYRSPDQNQLVAVVVNDTDAARPVRLSPPTGFGSTQAWQTDANRDCESVNPSDSLPPKSVRTFVFEKQTGQAAMPSQNDTPSQSSNDGQPASLELQGKFVRRGENEENIIFITPEKKRFWVIKAQHEKASPHIDKDVKIEAQVKPTPNGKGQMIIYLRKIAAAG
ncbi:MAG: glycoside hydrolase family 3 N-terminal domain-containing protein [Pirellulaceae bacterium]|nr:glycoside hydrolase family 3 N-terminal domain-containing protein [Pirellulaceae bacterium]